MIMKRLSFFLALPVIFAMCSIGMLSNSAYAQKVYRGHGLALHGDVKYGPDFSHFDYVNPDAPKGGTVRLGTVGTYDSFNPFILKGVSASGIALIYDTLTVQSDDEPFTEYGLLAETIELPEDRSWVAFTLRKEATWHDGSPVTADDVIFTFNTLIEKGSPFYKYYYNDVIDVKKVSARKVRFEFREGVNPELPLILGQLPVLSQKYYTANDFSKTSLDPPLGSGPYRVEDVNPGRSVSYRRVENYWGRDIPVNRGRWNYDEIRYEYYRDETVLVEAFKAGDYDFRLENVSKVWATAYTGSNFDKGLIVKEELPNENPTGMQGWVFNTRRSLFRDRRVRLALTYAFDFEWTNRTLFYGQYERTKSYFSNSELASSGLPGTEELELLDPFRERLPEEVFTREYEPPSTDVPGGLRTNLQKALRLLQEAGWEHRNGQLVNRETGEPFRFEFLVFQPSTERIAVPFKNNLSRMGIEMEIRSVDASQYVNRLDSYDFDMTSVVWAQSLSPGNEQRDFWSSEAADRPGTRNLAGIRDPVVDHLIDRVITAPDRKGLIAACRALDRVLLWGYYCIPNWHTRVYRVAYWNKFGKPAVKPKYALGFTDTWWVDPGMERELNRRK
jgi:microcin C transport system substrate-binding protein